MYSYTLCLERSRGVANQGAGSIIDNLQRICLVYLVNVLVLGMYMDGYQGPSVVSRLKTWSLRSLKNVRNVRDEI